MKINITNFFKWPLLLLLLDFIILLWFLGEVSSKLCSTKKEKKSTSQSAAFQEREILNKNV